MQPTLSDKGLPFFLNEGVYSPSNPISPKNEMACMDIKETSTSTHFTLKICRQHHHHLQVPEKNNNKNRIIAKKNTGKHN
jgi:sulfur relay (sulfurtransferase) complex TusBCD TusD component (DsrE family)